MHLSTFWCSTCTVWLYIKAKTGKFLSGLSQISNIGKISGKNVRCSPRSLDGWIIGWGMQKFYKHLGHITRLFVPVPTCLKNRLQPIQSDPRVSL